MTILLIRNNARHHCEIIESVIIKHDQIIGQKAEVIYLDLNKDLRWNSQIKDYICEKYPNIKLGLPKKYDFFIHVNLNNKTKIAYSKNSFYIAHNFNQSHVNLKNVFWISPFYERNIKANILPFSEKVIKNKDFPIYIIQGNKNPGRRNFKLLDNILNEKYDKKFLIRWNGSGKLPEKYDIYKKQGILEETSGNFIDYHKNFLDCYCIIPLITKESHPFYYKSKLTSTINYAESYKLKCLIDIDLQNIYKLPDVEIFNDDNDIADAFRKTLNDFYI
jgi:hypothetical protein